METTILVYDNYTKIGKIMEPLLSMEGMKAVAVADEKELKSRAACDGAGLMLIDAELSEKGWCSGIELISDIRAASRIPMIIISGQTAETAKIMALNAGADDYVTEGCNPLVLLARIKSQLRRYRQLTDENDRIAGIYRIDGLEINDTTREVSVDGRDVRLTPIEYNILKLLVQERGKVISIDRIYETIWHMRAVGADNTVAVHVRHIREKIESNPKEPRYLKVVWGTGYRVG
jgi:DNA-binding response OmpR family regulator